MHDNALLRLTIRFCKSVWGTGARSFRLTQVFQTVRHERRVDQVLSGPCLLVSLRGAKNLSTGQPKSNPAPPSQRMAQLQPNRNRRLRRL